VLSKSQPYRKALSFAFLISSALFLCTQAVAQTTTWTKIATEGASFSVSGTQTVRFGADTRWVQKVMTGSGQCTNAFFGKDPAVGVGKSCQVLGTTTATTTWTKIATEGAAFSVSGTQTVRFGADTRWVQKVMTGSGQCTNAFFGKDPAVGVGKSCQLLTSGSTSPPATTGTAALSWTAPPGTVTGYRVYYGAASHSYVQARGTGLLVKTPSATVSGLATGHTYYFAVTAISASGTESAYSNEASKVIP